MQGVGVVCGPALRFVCLQLSSLRRLFGLGARRTGHLRQLSGRQATVELRRKHTECSRGQRVTQGASQGHASADAVGAESHQRGAAGACKGPGLGIVEMSVGEEGEQDGGESLQHWRRRAERGPGERGSVEADEQRSAEADERV